MCAIHSITVEQVQGDSRKGATGKTNVTTLGCWPFLVIIGWRPTGLEMQKLLARALGHLPQLAPLIALSSAPFKKTLGHVLSDPPEASFPLIAYGHIRSGPLLGMGSLSPSILC